MNDKVILHKNAELIYDVDPASVITMTKAFGKTFYHKCIDVLIKHKCMFKEIIDPHKELVEFEISSKHILAHIVSETKDDTMSGDLEYNCSINALMVLVSKVKTIEGVPKDFVDWDLIYSLTMSETYVCVKCNEV